MHGLLLRCVSSAPGTSARKTPQPVRLTGGIQAWPIRWFRVSRFNSISECGNRVRDARTPVICLSLESIVLRLSYQITAFIVERVCHG